jgi:4'-phosphopantetheinyl transferase
MTHTTGSTHPSHHWPPPPPGLELERAQVHIWRASLAGTTADRGWLVPILSPAELHRANRFHFDRDRWRFIAAHTALRVILSRYTAVRPEQIRFHTGDYGKPALAYPRSGLEFNISHSHELLLVAIATGRAVGVDLEHIRPLDDFEAIAQRTFSPLENEALAAVPGPQRLESFFRCWTRKEAFIKALGQGLSYPLDQFHVTLAPDEPAALLKIDQDPGAVARWSMHAFSPAPGYLAALVVAGQPPGLKFWQYRPGPAVPHP